MEYSIFIQSHFLDKDEDYVCICYIDNNGLMYNLKYNKSVLIAWSPCFFKKKIMDYYENKYILRESDLCIDFKTFKCFMEHINLLPDIKNNVVYDNDINICELIYLSYIYDVSLLQKFYLEKTKEYCTDIKSIIHVFVVFTSTNYGHLSDESKNNEWNLFMNELFL